MTDRADAHGAVRRGVTVRLPSLPNNWRGWFWQGLLLAAIAAVVWYFAGNTVHNLARKGIPIGFAFLSRPAGFDIPFRLLEWSTRDTYGRAVLVALCNTLLVSV